VSGKRRAVHKQRIVANLAVVPHVRGREKKIIVADPRDLAALRGSTADGHMLAKNVSTAHVQFDAFTAKRVVLRIAANRAKGVKYVVSPEFRRTPHHRVLVQHASIAQLDASADHGIGANLHARAQFRFL
jgi:hypothetical protein